LTQEISEEEKSQSTSPNYLFFLAK